MKKTIAFLLLASVSSCKKFIAINPPIDKITTTTAFTDDATATAAMSGIYSTMMQNYPYFGSFAMSLYPGLAADELTSTRSLNSELEIVANQISSQNGEVYDIWRTAYKYIYQCNAVLEGIAASQNLSATTKAQLKGEARFMRAFIYFHLVNLFGDVPLVTTTSYLTNQHTARTPRSQVYEHIIADLQEAEGHLPLQSAAKARPAKMAATALLARVYLYLADWNKTDEAATEVINSGRYSLEPNLSKVFLNTSPETIWQLASSVSNVNSYEGMQFIPVLSTMVPPYPLAGDLVNAFEANDGRRTEWVKSTTVNGETWYYPFKYKIRRNATVTENPVYLRLAEMYLVRAEAEAQTDMIPDAVEDVNVIRRRAGLTDTTLTEKQAVLDAIEHERRIEFFSEWGHRWFDLKRWGKADAVLSFKPGWQPTDTLWPVPYSELQRNPSLIQNPGY